MNRDDLQVRTKMFALRVIKLADALPKSVSGRTIAHQIIRSGTSVASNYRAARRARSRKEFAAKIGIVVEEADETEFWLEMIIDANLLPFEKVEPLRIEAEALMRIFASTRRTTLSNGSPKKYIAKPPNRQTAKSKDFPI